MNYIGFGRGWIWFEFWEFAQLLLWVTSSISIPQEREISGLEIGLMQQHRNAKYYRKFCSNTEQETAIIPVPQTGD